MAQKKNRIHDWRNLKWPFTATFLYYALICLFTGTAEQNEMGFAMVLMTTLIVDAVAYACYIFFLSRWEENMPKLWFVFILAFGAVSYPELTILWEMMQQRAGVL